MSEEIKTPCECPMAGYCARHHIKKNAHFHKLCQTRQDYFDMYEACAGPGQEFTDCSGSEPIPIEIEQKPIVEQPVKREPIKTEHKTPSLWQKAKSFTKAAVEQAKGGMKNVEESVQQDRMNTCLGCEFYNTKNQTCNKCGCFLPIKTKWLANSCPEGKWKE